MESHSYRIARTYFALLCLVNVCMTASAQTGSITDGTRTEKASELPPDLQDASRAVQDRLKADRIRRNSLERRVARFVASRAPLSHVVFCLNRLGVNVCYERVAGPVDRYVDADGVSAFVTDKPISLTLDDVTVREILDEICKADSRYTWKGDERRGLYILHPRRDSRLTVTVGPVKESGNPYEVLARISRKHHLPVLATDVIRGGNNLPDVALDLPRCTALELLNEIVGQHPGMTWRAAEDVTLNYPGSAWAESVQLEYPPVTKGEHSNSAWRYKIVERRINGVPIVTVERQATGMQSSRPAGPGTNRP